METHLHAGSIVQPAMLVYQSIILPETNSKFAIAPETIHLQTSINKFRCDVIYVSLGDWGHLNIFMNPTGCLVMCACVCFIHLFFGAYLFVVG